MAMGKGGQEVGGANVEKHGSGGNTGRDAPDVQDTIKNLRYEPFDPKNLTEEQRALQDHLDHLVAFHNLKDTDWLTVVGFDSFSMLAARAWPRLCYESHIIAGGYLYWMTDAHATAIGRALRPGMKALRLDLTRPQKDGFSVMADAVAPGVTVPELFLSHRSGDEVTVAEARGIARLSTRLECRTLHLWAMEYDRGALDALAEEFGKLGNRTLRQVDACDTSKKEPDDQIAHPALSALVKKNKKK